MKRPRDAQRQRLYDAERRAFGNPTDLDGSFERAQAFIDEIQSSSWWREHARLDVPKLVVDRSYRGRSVSRAGGTMVEAYGADGLESRHGLVHLTPSHRHVRWVVVHELMHWAQPKGTAWHGVEFCSLYLSATRRFLGREAAEALALAFVQKNVRHRPLKPERQVGSRAATRGFIG
jgi:hypothetical protein